MRIASSARDVERGHALRPRRERADVVAHAGRVGAAPLERDEQLEETETDGAPDDVAQLDVPARQAHVDRVDEAAGRFERADSVFARADDRSLHGEDSEIGAERDPQARQRGVGGREEVRAVVGKTERIARVLAREHLQECGGVRDRSRERTALHERRDRAEAVRPGDRRHAAERRLHADDAAQRRGHPDRAGAVGAERGGHHACRDRGRAAAGRSARVRTRAER